MHTRNVLLSALVAVAFVVISLLVFEQATQAQPIFPLDDSPPDDSPPGASPLGDSPPLLNLTSLRHGRILCLTH